MKQKRDRFIYDAGTSRAVHLSSGILENVSQERVFDQLPQKAKERQAQFRHWRNHTQIYWRGAHYEYKHRFRKKVV